MYNGTASVRQLAIPQMVTVIIWLSKSTPRNMLKNICLHKNLYMDVHSRITHGSLGDRWTFLCWFICRAGTLLLALGWELKWCCWTENLFFPLHEWLSFLTAWWLGSEKEKGHPKTFSSTNFCESRSGHRYHYFCCLLSVKQSQSPYPIVRNIDPNSWW